MSWDLSDIYTQFTLGSILRVLSLEQVTKLNLVLGFPNTEINSDLQMEIQKFILKSERYYDGIWDSPLEVMLIEILDTISIQNPLLAEEIEAFFKYNIDAWEYRIPIPAFRDIATYDIELPLENAKKQFLKSVAYDYVNMRRALNSMLDLIFNSIPIDQGFRYMKIESWMRHQISFCLSIKSWGIITQIITQEDITIIQKWIEELNRKLDGAILFCPDLTTIPPDLVAFYQKIN